MMFMLKMDVLRPPLVWVGNRCYRKTVTGTSDNTDFAEDDDATEVCDVYADEMCEVGLNIESTASGYKLAMACPSVCFGLIIGKRGETKKRIESETRTEIRIPRQGEIGDIEIRGKDRNGVSSAHTRISVLIENARRRQPFTHFISFPMVSEGIQAKFDEFKEDVLRFCEGERGVDASIFQNPSKLHMTVGTLTLLDDAEIESAAQILKSCHDELISCVLEERPLVADIRGLEYMNDDPNAVDVLYAKVSLQDGSSRLQTLAEALVDRFVSAGLMERQYDQVKLHITVMNTLFRKESKTSSAQNLPRGKVTEKERECFDARKIFKLYGDYNFGMLRIGSIHMSQRLSTAADGCYTAAASIGLPQ